MALLDYCLLKLFQIVPFSVGLDLSWHLREETYLIHPRLCQLGENSNPRRASEPD